MNQWVLKRTKDLPIDSSMKPAPICSSTPIIRWTGIPGEEALQKARDEDKPIFQYRLLRLSLVSCDGAESFENEAIARIMNEHFINIKVDREERPDR